MSQHCCPGHLQRCYRLKSTYHNTSPLLLFLRREQRHLWSLLQALLFFALDLLNAPLRYWHIFRHDSAGFSNCPTYDPAHLEMSLIGFPFASDLFALEFLTRLARAERICNQLITLHPVQNALALLKALTRMN